MSGRWNKEVTNNQSFIYGNMLFVDYFVDSFIFTNNIEWNATAYGLMTAESIGNVVCIDESGGEGKFKWYPAAAFNNSDGDATIGYLEGMETRAAVRNAHIVGAIPVYPKT